jgi:predicted component of type VI protein secretion system
MLLLRVTDDRGAVTQHFAESFPFRIGRAPTADLRLEARGVWDLHATIALGESGKFFISSEAASFLLVNGSATSTAPLNSGDELTLGAVRIVVGLAPARQTRLRLAEALVWLLLASLILVQVGAIILAR